MECKLASVRRWRRREIVRRVERELFRYAAWQTLAIQFRGAADIGVVVDPLPVGRSIELLHDLCACRDRKRRPGIDTVRRKGKRPDVRRRSVHVVCDCLSIGRYRERMRTESRGDPNRIAIHPAVARHLCGVDVGRAEPIGYEVQPSTIGRPERTLVDRAAIGHGGDRAVAYPDRDDAARRPVPEEETKPGIFSVAGSARDAGSIRRPLTLGHFPEPSQRARAAVRLVDVQRITMSVRDTAVIGRPHGIDDWIAPDRAHLRPRRSAGHCGLVSTLTESSVSLTARPPAIWRT